MKKQHQPPRLSDQSRAILQQGKTDMITTEVVHLRHFPEGSIEAARSAIRRLCGGPPDYLYIRPEPLDARRVYYRLTTLGAKLLGISPSYACVLKKQGRAQRYAVSWYIHADRPGPRLLFNPRDFARELGLHGQHLPRHPFFIDETLGRPRLGFILVDHNAHPRRIVRKTIKPLARFLYHGWFDDFIRQDAFIVALLTSSEFRKRAFQEELPRAIGDQLRYRLSRLRPDLENGLPVDIQVQVIPGLGPLVMHRRNRTPKP